VFHIGFFNFYLSLGLCFWAMALTWRWDRRRALPALAILTLAFVAHALPVMWAVALTAYRWLAESAPPERRPLLAAGGLAAMIVARMALNLAMEMRVQPAQLRLVSGADQLLVYDSKYGWLTFALLAFWTLRLVDVGRGGGHKLLAGMPFQFCLLTAAAIAIFPSWILVPGYKHALAFIADRLSLPMAVCVCALVSGPPGSRRFRTWQVAAVTIAALAFFGMLYRDEGLLNGFEDRLEALVAELPPGQRVLNTVNDPVPRSGPVGHMIDRVCVGRCYSYGNYEPTTAQFRVRATATNPLVVPTYQESYAIEIGKYVIKERDLPLYLVVVDADGRLAIRRAEAGVPVGTISVDLL
jgi:hypothetical protein